MLFVGDLKFEHYVWPPTRKVYLYIQMRKWLEHKEEVEKPALDK